MTTAYALTRSDAITRSENLTVSTIDVTLDISKAANPEQQTFAVSSTFSLSSKSESTFVDVAGRVLCVDINGVAQTFTHTGSRLFIENLPVDEPFTLTINAECFYSRTGEGLHRYTDPEDGRHYLYTQFEPTDAHRAWPCFDQPDIKPRWTFQVDAPAGWVVTSNGAVAQQSNFDEVTRWVFTQTPPLSSYITALVAGEYALVDGGEWLPSPETIAACPQAEALRLPLRLMCRQSLAPFMDYEDILEVTRQGLDYFHQHYRVAYPWGTYDQIFVPEYNLGAMENPGCVTFNERMLSRDTPTFALRQSRANVILHEMCHMWFGDLATPAWWDDLWLKESFADNQGTMAAAEATQYTGEWASFAVERKAWAYQQDSYPTTHPIAADIPDVDAAKNNFDGITYAKGAAVLKQLVAWVGRDVFFNAAHDYFIEHQFGATSLHDLLLALQAQTGSDLSEWERLWLHTTGPSQLHATWTEGEEGQIRDFVLRQTSVGDAPLCLRPHQLIISVFTEDDGTLVKSHSFPVRIDGESALIDPEGVLDVAGAARLMDLVVINDEDLTYAVTRFDPRSTRTALTLASTIQDVTTRAVVWSTLWLAVRDGLLSASTYVEAVLRHAPAESDDAVLERLMATVGVAISQYVPARERPRLRRLCVDACVEVLHRDLSEDRRREWAGLFLTAIRSLDDVTAFEQDVLEEAARGVSVLIPSNQAMRWQALTVLAARGEIDQEELDAALALAPTGEAQVHHVRASSALPLEDLRAERWATACHGSLSNDHLTATLEGLALSRWEGYDLRDAFFKEVRSFWDGHSIGMGIRFIRAAYPESVDLDTPALSSELLQAAQEWLSENEDAPAALRRLMIERADDIRRALNAQRGA